MWALGYASTGSYAVCSASDSVEGVARVTVVTRSVRSSGVQPGGESIEWTLYPNFFPQHVHRRYPDPGTKL